MRFAIAIDRLALHVLEDEVRLAIVAHARVEQSGDMWVRKSRQKTRFVPDVRCRIASQPGPLEQLQGRASFEPAVTATPEPDAAHSTASQEALNDVRADLFADQ